MGFHKRYIDDEQIIRIYRNEGCQAVIDWFTSGVDAVILSGERNAILSLLIIFSLDFYHIIFVYYFRF